jgi:GAF domain-containing protein
MSTAGPRALPPGLGTEREQDFEEIAELAAIVCGTPISIVSVLDDEWQYHKASLGMAFSRLPITVSFCRHTVAQEGVFIVPDAQADPRFAKNPIVTGEPHVRFYAGAPIHSPEGDKIGALCVIDTIPRELKAYQTHALALLARQANAQIGKRVTQDVSGR